MLDNSIIEMYRRVIDGTLTLKTETFVQDFNRRLVAHPPLAVNGEALDAIEGFSISGGGHSPY